MKNITDRTRIIWAAGAVFALSVCYLLGRFILIETPGGDQWQLIMFVASLIVLSIANSKKSKKVMIFTVVGYISGFVAGILFGVEGVDLGGGATHNGWWIWAFPFILSIIIGAAWDIICRHRK